MLTIERSESHGAPSPRIHSSYLKSSVRADDADSFDSVAMTQSSPAAYRKEDGAMTLAMEALRSCVTMWENFQSIKERREEVGCFEHAFPACPSYEGRLTDVGLHKRSGQQKVGKCVVFWR